MADLATLKKQLDDAKWHWFGVRPMNAGFGVEAATAALLRYQIAMTNYNRALKEQP